MSNKRKPKLKTVKTVKPQGLACRIAMRVDAKVHAELLRRARAEHRSLSNYVHRLLAQHVAAPVAPVAPAVPVDEDEQPAHAAAA